MFILTEKMKNWLSEHKQVDSDASDETFMKAGYVALSDGSLTPDDCVKLTSTKEDKQADDWESMFQDLKSTVSEVKRKVFADDEVKETKSETVETKEETPAETKAVSDKPRQPTRLEKMLATMGSSDLLSEDEEYDVRVKSAVEAYSDTKAGLKFPNETKAGRPHALAGQPVKDFGRTLNEGSELDKALAGVWAKYQILAVTPKLAGNPQSAWDRLTDHEKSLLVHLTEKGEWDDSKDDRLAVRKGYEGGIKALIDDSTSGGLEAAPIVFDDRVIEAPLLYGELFPLVNTTTLSRGRRVEGVAVDKVTGGWGGVDNTAVALFDTTSYVTAFDTTIFRWEGAVEMGLDFLSDTPINFGEILTRQYGERLLEDLDDVIATGNGTTQPEGVMNKSGTTSVTFSSTMSIGNMESLRYGVAKPELTRGPSGTAVFCGTESTWQSVRAIPVGGSDARRLFGYDHFAANANYSFAGAQFRINESLTNAQIFYGVLGRFRMYRRKGLAIRTTTEGKELTRKNLMLIVAMARYGGQLERGACAAKTTDAPA